MGTSKKIVSDLLQQIAQLNAQVFTAEKALDLKRQKLAKLETTLRVLRKDLGVSIPVQKATPASKNIRPPSASRSRILSGASRGRNGPMAKLIRETALAQNGEFTGMMISDFIKAHYPDIAARLAQNYVTIQLWKLTKAKSIRVLRPGAKGEHNTYITNHA